MQADLWDRLMLWLCSKLGHRLPKKKSIDQDLWFYKGKWHAVCRRCRTIYSPNSKNTTKENIKKF